MPNLSKKKRIWGCDVAEAFRRDNFNMEGIVSFMILVSTVISHDGELNENISLLLSAITTNLFGLNASQNSSLKTQVERLKKVAVSLNKNIFNDLTGAKATIKSLVFDKKDDYIVLIDSIQSRLEEIRKRVEGKVWY